VFHLGGGGVLAGCLYGFWVRRKEHAACQSHAANRGPASPFNAGRQLGSASCAPPSPSAAVAESD
jgi:hypothetical protein